MLLALAAVVNAAPAERLDRLFAAAPLAAADDRAALAALAAADPVTAWQLSDPARRAAIAYVLALPAAEIRAVKQGQAVIRAAGEGSDAEWAALWALAEATGERPRRVQQVRIRTVEASLVRVDLELRRETVGVDLAFPDEAAPPRMTGELRRAFGVEVPAPRPLQDGGFETAWSAGLSWEEASPPGTAVTRDAARVRSGGHSLRLESHTRAVPTVTQELAARPGERLVLTAAIGADGADGVVALVFRAADGGETRHAARVGAGEIGWGARTVDAVVPAGATARVELTLGGAGAANFDDVGVRAWGGAAEPLTSWVPTTRAATVTYADPTRCGPEARDGAPCGEGDGARLDAAVVAGLTRLSVGAEGRVEVWVFADEEHRAAARGPAGPRGTRDDRCEGVVTDPWAAACPLARLLGRAWGPPGNEVFGVGLPRALAGSGVDLHAAALPSLAGVGSLAARVRVVTPGREAAATSFAAWLLETGSLAAVRAAWQADDLAAYRIAGRSFAEIEADWRAFVGG